MKFYDMQSRVFLSLTLAAAGGVRRDNGDEKRRKGEMEKNEKNKEKEEE